MTDEEEYDDVATTFKLVTTRTDEGPEEWQVRIVGWPDDSEPDENDVLVDAVVYRALIDQNWFERFDSVDQNLASIGEDLLDRDLLEQIDEEAAFAKRAGEVLLSERTEQQAEHAIIVVDSVEVREGARGSITKWFAHSHERSATTSSRCGPARSRRDRKPSMRMFSCSAGSSGIGRTWVSVRSRTGRR